MQKNAKVFQAKSYDVIVLDARPSLMYDLADSNKLPRTGLTASKEVQEWGMERHPGRVCERPGI